MLIETPTSTVTDIGFQLTDLFTSFKGFIVLILGIQLFFFIAETIISIVRGGGGVDVSYRKTLKTYQSDVSEAMAELEAYNKLVHSDIPTSEVSNLLKSGGVGYFKRKKIIKDIETKRAIRQELGEK